MSLRLASQSIFQTSILGYKTGKYEVLHEFCKIEHGGGRNVIGVLSGFGTPKLKCVFFQIQLI